jgi:hypothetical protein
MPTRTFVDADRALAAATAILSDRSFESPWSRPIDPTVVFKDHSLPGFSVQHHGGPVGSGAPVQLLFWGDWWNTDEGVARRSLYVKRVQDLLVSPYFSELVQYGIAKPHWRGALVVTEPAPPASFKSKDDVQKVPDLIVDLIEDDVFPDPDDEKIAFLVFMAKGFTTVKETGNGSHMKDFDYEFPWDKDWFWVAWIRFFGNAGATGGDEDPEDAIRTFSHELVEMLSDPELDGWYVGRPEDGEIADAATTPGDGTKQTAWVNGAHVQGYWSNQHGATVIPMDRDYGGKIVGSIHTDHRETTPGTFRPEPEDTKFCELIPQCCMEPRDYRFTSIRLDETVRLRVETERYLQPVVAWSVGGVAVTASTVLHLEAMVGTFEGRHARYGLKTVTVKCTLTNNDLALQTVGTLSNFDLDVTCQITEGAIKGNVKTNVVAAPSVTVGFVGADVLLDPDYVAQRSACAKVLATMFKKANRAKSRKQKVGDPVVFDPGILADLPAHARLTQYQHARHAVDLARVASAVLPAAQAKRAILSLFSDVPALQGALFRQEARKSQPCYQESALKPR